MKMRKRIIAMAVAMCVISTSAAPSVWAQEIGPAYRKAKNRRRSWRSRQKRNCLLNSQGNRHRQASRRSWKAIQESRHRRSQVSCSL